MNKKLILAAMAATALLAMTGCQTIVNEEYYDITAANKDFAIKGKDGKPSLGPLKRRSNKDGAADWSDGKHLEINALKAGSIGM